ncbi:hypothetical protein [Rugamonas sp.]|uniref:hypothetical protein n=1 Tax=Rugamonas sp. TaxID=1926287 RepID=UPI0025D3FB6F|nr:hypothetical protein [Rugamonas sp.]
MHAPPHAPAAMYGIAAAPPAPTLTVEPVEAVGLAGLAGAAGHPVSDADLTLLLRARNIEREVMALRDLLSAASGDAGREQFLRKEIVRLLSKVILFRAGLARE